MQLALALLLLSRADAQGFDSELSRATLRGLDGVEVVVENLQPDVERDGLTTQQIKTAVELRLRKAGIQVMTQHERQRAPGQPFLVVSVGTYQNPSLRVYAFTIGVGLYQTTHLDRDPYTAVSAVTWSPEGSIGTVGRANVRDIRASVADSVDEFINAYLAANPEQAGRAPPPSRASPPTKRR